MTTQNSETRRDIRNAVFHILQGHRTGKNIYEDSDEVTIVKPGVIDDVSELIRSEALALLDRLNNSCEYCNGNGFMRVYPSGDRHEIPDIEPCDGEIHDLVEAERRRYGRPTEG